MSQRPIVDKGCEHRERHMPTVKSTGKPGHVIGVEVRKHEQVNVRDVEVAQATIDWFGLPANVDNGYCSMRPDD
jgi:hypothetical protein